MADQPKPLKLAVPERAKRGRVMMAPIAAAVPVSMLGSSFSEVALALETMWGPLPIRLRAEHATLLRAMGIGACERGQPFMQLAEALDRIGAIEISLAEEG